MTDYLDALIDEAALHGRVSAGAPLYAERWTPEEDDFLRQNRLTMTTAEIAKALGRSGWAVYLRWERQLGLPALTKHPEWLTAGEAARRLGFSCNKKVVHLINLGLLPGRMAPLDRDVHLVHVNDLTKFAVNPENWAYMQPWRVKDAKLRRLVTLRQQRWGDEWWTPGQVAAYHGVSLSGVNAQIQKGYLPAKRWDNWRIKRSDAIRARFTGGRGSSITIEWTDAGDAFLVLARAVGLSWVAVERACKWPRGRPPFRFNTLTEQGRLVTICATQGIQYDPIRNLMLADWRNYRQRFPRLAGAVDRFLGDQDVTPEDLSIVAGILSGWGQWYAKTPEQYMLAEGWRHYSAVTRATVERAYRELLGWGVEPLGEVIHVHD